MSEISIRDILQRGKFVEELSDGQFTGGVYSEKWQFDDTYYEVTFDNGQPVEFELYVSAKEKSEILKTLLRDYFLNKKHEQNSPL